MLISTINDLPGSEVTEVLGEVFGPTVRSRNIGSQIGAGFKSLAGGELKGMTKNLIACRQEVTQRMVEGGGGKGGRRDLGHAVRRFGNRRQLDRDLRLRHGREGPQDLVGPSVGPAVSGHEARRLLRVESVPCRAHSARSTSAVGVRAAMRPGTAATRLASTSAARATKTTSKTGTVGSGTA